MADIRNRTKVLLVVAAVLVVLVGGAVWWFLQDDAPPEVSLEAAVESVDSAPSDASTTEADPASTSGDATDVTGTWTVDVDSGEFDFESATGTFAGFRIAENLASVGSTTAVGRTGDVSGSAAIDGTTLTAASFEVDLTTITTNESRRNSRVHQALETTTFPTATFTLTEPVDLGAGAADGQPVSVTATGDLTIHGVTQAVEVPIDAQLVDGTIVLVGSTDISFSDYGVEVPSSPVVLSVDDHGTVEVQILLTKG